MIEQTFARCINRCCRHFDEVQYVARPAYHEGRLVASCPYCGARLLALTSRELRELRSARNRLQDER